MDKNQYSVIIAGTTVSQGFNWRKVLTEFFGELSQAGVRQSMAFCVNNLMLCFPMGETPGITRERQFGLAGKNYREFSKPTRRIADGASRTWSGETSVKAELSRLLNDGQGKLRIDFPLIETPAGRGAGRLILWVDQTPHRNLQAYGGVHSLMEDAKLIEQFPVPPWATLQ